MTQSAPYDMMIFFEFVCNVIETDAHAQVNNPTEENETSYSPNAFVTYVRGSFCYVANCHSFASQVNTGGSFLASTCFFLATSKYESRLVLTTEVKSLEPVRKSSRINFFIALSLEN